MNRSNNRLIIFAKAPRVGIVKTRLANEIGLINAWAFYRWRLVEITRKLSSDTRWKTLLSMTPDRSQRLGIIPSTVPILNQGSGDLGTRMNNTMSNMPPGPTIIVGTDIPGIESRIVANAFKELGKNDVVLGPAHDGGYWLIGCRRRPRFPNIFTGVRWSTVYTLADTLKNASREKLSIHCLMKLEDVDNAASYNRWRFRKK